MACIMIYVIEYPPQDCYYNINEGKDTLFIKYRKLVLSTVNIYMAIYILVNNLH